MGAQITTIIDLWVRASLCYLWIPCWMLSCWKHLAESCYQYPHSTSALSESTSWVLTRTRTWLYVAGKRTAHDTGGMDTKLICLRCKSKGVKPILTSALHQLCRNPLEAAICPNCHSVQDQATLVSWKVWKNRQKIPSSAEAFLCSEIDFETTLGAVVQTTTHANTVRMALSSFRNGIEQRSMPGMIAFTQKIRVRIQKN